ncbi:LPS export ABC transporter periplasmic protein LptC [candidate division WOR-3 bacterium]|uniref:LPS export ABC transporter periplasmic protein LptC n=1 Tax=candidate division WOR-3 bacterium TaxID=2052148 RepID=A0A9D5KBN8_UNCW3|nr:LPS export ABC transporter periplasmic protein LptC [candidate division WOR-3 bacterium]MBD3364806.1 LPS export ABC transporter periplasmic protein LptC [candidate division WOR-3 bacterium]
MANLGRLMKKLVLFILILSVACSQSELPSGKTVELPDQIVDNFQMEESASDKERYSLTGKRAFYYNKHNRIVVHEPEIEFYGPRKEVTAHVVCDSGIVNNKSGDLVAYGKVVVTTEDGTELRTDSLVWFNRRAKIETDAMVHITSPEGTIEGKGLISDAYLNRIEIKEEVSGTTEFSVEED